MVKQPCGCSTDEEASLLYQRSGGEGHVDGQAQEKRPSEIRLPKQLLVLQDPDLLELPGLLLPGLRPGAIEEIQTFTVRRSAWKDLTQQVQNISSHTTQACLHARLASATIHQMFPISAERSMRRKEEKKTQRSRAMKQVLTPELHPLPPPPSHLSKPADNETKVSSLNNVDGLTE